jgi:choline dehydrogenase-like flavoprotein
MFAAAPALSDLKADVCVVGSGPVGLSLAIALAQKGARVVLLEAGSRSPARKRGISGADEFVSGDTHAPMDLAACRAFGGTSWLWGGRCLPLDPLDFETRPQVPGGAWPIRESDVSPYYAQAASLLGCGAAVFTDAAGEPWQGQLRDGLRIDTLERWCDEPVLPLQRDKASLPENLTVVLDATVTGATLDAGKIIGLRVAFGGSTMIFDGAKLFVLACGGVETARLLLHVQAEYPALFGGTGGPLGRNYMGHVSGSIATFVFDDPKTAALFSYRFEKGSATRRRLTLDVARQRSEGLPNVSFYPDNPRMADPSHGSGVLSGLFLLLSTPGVGRRLISEAIRKMQMTDTPRYSAHLRNVMLDSPRALRAAWNLFRQKFIEGRRKPSLFLLSRSGEYPLHYHGEHLPKAESCVSLGESLDSFGMRRLKIDLRFSAQDAAGIARAHLALDRALRESRMGQLRFRDPPGEREAAILFQARDGYHQMGLARMGVDAGDGVVDADCKVFGLTNLYIAGSAVFRTSGEANPTFFATALALRLADRLTRALKAGDA